MYFFDLEDYYGSRIIGYLNTRHHSDWTDSLGTARETRNAYLKAFNEWYISATKGISDSCMVRIEELYKLIRDDDNPDGSNMGAVASAQTYNTIKFMYMMYGINSSSTGYFFDDGGDPSSPYYYAWSGKCFDEQVYYDYVNAYKEFKCVTNELLYLIDGDDVGRCEKYSSVSDSGKTRTECGDCKAVNLDTFLTTDLPTINNVDEFRKAITSELIDAKNRQTLSSYPTLQLLYERYLGNCTDCEKNINRFTYDTMTTFIDLIGKHWVDLAEQFVPATTIWGATDVYRNTVFHQQKHKYRRSNLEFNRQPTEDNPLLSCVRLPGDIVKWIDYGPLRDVERYKETIIYDITKQDMPETLEASATTINFQAAAQTDETPRSNPDTPMMINFQVGTTTQTFGNLTNNQVNAIQSQIDTTTKQATSGNVFQVKKSTNYGLSSGPAHCSPMFYGKVTVTSMMSNRS